MGREDEGVTKYVDEWTAVRPRWASDGVSLWTLNDEVIFADGWGDTPEEAWLDYWVHVSEILEGIKRRLARFGDDRDKESEHIVRSYIRAFIDRSIGLPRERRGDSD